MAIFTQQYIFDITRFRTNQCGLDIKFGYKIRVIHKCHDSRYNISLSWSVKIYFYSFFKSTIYKTRFHTPSHIESCSPFIFLVNDFYGWLQYLFVHSMWRNFKTTYVRNFSCQYGFVVVWISGKILVCELSTIHQNEYGYITHQQLEIPRILQLKDKYTFLHIKGFDFKTFWGWSTTISGEKHSKKDIICSRHNISY